MKVSTVPIAHRIKHLQPIFSIAKSSRQFCTGGMNGEMKLWGLSYEHLKTIKKHAGSINCVGFSHDGKYIASAGDDGKVFVFNQNAEDVVQTIKHPSDVTHLLWTPEFLISTNFNGEVLVTRISDFSEFRLLKNHDKSILGVAMSPDYRHLVTCSETKIALYENFNIRAERAMEKGLVLENLQSKVSFAPSGKFISLGLQFNRKIPTVDILDTELNPVFSLAGHVAPCEITAFCPLTFRNLKKFYIIAVASQDLSVSLWNTLNPKPFVLLKNLTDSPVLDMFWDGLVLYISSYDGQVKRIEIDQNEVGEIVPEGTEENDFSVPFSDKNMELRRSYEKRSVKLNLDERIDVIKLTGFTIKNNKRLEDYLAEQVEESRPKMQAESALAPKPKRITPVLIEQPRGPPLHIRKDSSVVVLFDTNKPEKLKMERAEPFKLNLGDFAIELRDDGDVHVSRATHHFYRITGPCNKICFNDKYIAVYTAYVQVYELETGRLFLPFVSVKLASLDLLHDSVFLLDVYGDFTVINLQKKTSVAGKLAKTKGLCKIQLSTAYFLVAEYVCNELVFYDRKMRTWLAINPQFCSIVSGGVDFNNSNDDTIAELELCFRHYAWVRDRRNMKCVVKQLVGVLKRMKRLDGVIEYKLDGFLTEIDDRKFSVMILEELNQVPEFQRFVARVSRKVTGGLK